MNEPYVGPPVKRIMHGAHRRADEILNDERNIQPPEKVIRKG